MKLKCITTMNKDDTIAVGARNVRMLRVGDTRADGGVTGLSMTLNAQTGIISIDAPGVSSLVHLSKVTAEPMEPTIPSATPVEERPLRQPAPVAPTVTAPARDTSDELDSDDGEEEPTYADEELDDDDPEVARLLQGEDAKKAVEQRKVKPAKKGKKAPV